MDTLYIFKNPISGKGRPKSKRDNDEREHDQCPRTTQITVALSPAQRFTLPTQHAGTATILNPQVSQGRLSVFHHVNNPIFS